MNNTINFDKQGFEKLSSGVWALVELERFGYSDGVAAEKYLGQVFSCARDLSSNSHELQAAIKDWPSEYHLSVKRSQLLSGLDFGNASNVLEVGCGCGAITRFLGETFDSVTSVEGSLVRAELARQRCHDLANVNIVCSPFQSVRFTKKFDIVFCIGVLEYSASFVDSTSPYADVIDIFADVLKPNGTVVVAIENQFGLKYLNGCREDHVGRKFEGIEGYPRSFEKVRTFGRHELESMLRERFELVQFLFPYPDYKVPDFVLSQEFVSHPFAADLVSQNLSRDYVGRREPIWDEALAIHELARNRLLPEVADSFLVVASKNPDGEVTFPQLGLVYSSGRRPEFNTVSRITGRVDQMAVTKQRQNISSAPKHKLLSLDETRSNWIDGDSLFTQVYKRSMTGDKPLDYIFEPCRRWYQHILSLSIHESGNRVLSGSFVDATWRNCYMKDGICTFIDNEWRWKNSINLNVLVIRSIYIFLERVNQTGGLAEELLVRPGRTIIERIAAAFGASVSKDDLREFVEFESEFQYCVRGADRNKTKRYLALFMIDRFSLKRVITIVRNAKFLAGRIMSRLRRSVNRI